MGYIIGWQRCSDLNRPLSVFPYYTGVAVSVDLQRYSSPDLAGAAEERRSIRCDTITVGQPGVIDTIVRQATSQFDGVINDQ